MSRFRGKVLCNLVTNLLKQMNCKAKTRISRIVSDQVIDEPRVWIIELNAGFSALENDQFASALELDLSTTVVSSFSSCLHSKLCF